MERNKHISRLKKNDTFDLLVIGGGATGSGIAVDAASRGMKVLLVEKNDFAEGTSSRSTKLIHGGVRYLEKAFKHLDKEQYSFVKEGLYERGVILKNAPHLTNKIKFVTPLYKWIELPYVFAGLKLYDILSGKMRLGKSRLLLKKETLEKLPIVNNDGLKGGVLYYDGQFNDSRMAVMLVKTAVNYGATVLNHMEVTNLIKENNLISGVWLKDNISGETYTAKGIAVVNATGAYADFVRKMDSEEAEPVLKVSSGIHIVLDKKFAPTEYGMMIPETEDGRIIFVLPWEGHALVGTTDDPAVIRDHPNVTENEIEYVLKQIGKYYKNPPEKKDILSAWSGIRPLVKDPDAKTTEEILRNHYIEVSKSKLVTITGGKWTSYRHMAEDVVDRVISEFSLKAGPCITPDLKIAGGENFNSEDYKLLQQKYKIDYDIALHLHRSYGSLAEDVIGSTKKEKAFERLDSSHPYIEAEVYYCVKNEMAVHVVDFLIRRIPLGLLDIKAAKYASKRVLEIMRSILDWDAPRIQKEQKLISERFDEAI